jgi:hypothetical protein
MGAPEKLRQGSPGEAEAPPLVVELEPEPAAARPAGRRQTRQRGTVNVDLVLPPRWAEGGAEPGGPLEDPRRAAYAARHQPAREEWDPVREQSRRLPPPVDAQPVPVWPRQPSYFFTLGGAILACLFGPGLLLVLLMPIFFAVSPPEWSSFFGPPAPLLIFMWTVMLGFYLLYFRAYFRRQPWVPMYDVSGWLVTREVAGVRWVLARRSPGRVGWVRAERWEWLPRQEWERRQAEATARALALTGVALLGMILLHPRRRW